ncbi:(2E,6E)-farnesyl diphosphate synthase [Oceanospirillum sp. D5]|uniref:(2E,6E)-farnesyl diphosphate synthase n=1 Tax=Oceanospirillum sediminis TaxID=2760088 RepID=A0A839IMK5_9GAMM|nr:(2E,6E)-farnesyl diphosphate synthase [Oceanospirillum sediminis]
MKEKLHPLIDRTDQQLNRFLSEDSSASDHLLSAMRYSIFNGGKRIRPVLVYAAGQAVKARPEACDAPAIAVEMVHAYSLIHDDLPAMDDDDLRRGQPTCHIQYDEATAILAGDALQTSAFSALLTPAEQPGRLEILRELSDASGSLGMVAGQMIDLAAVGQTLNLAELENMHRHKTGALIRASVRMGALAGEASAIQLQSLTEYAVALGLAFQVQDDILDVESDTATLGKQQGADIAMNKPTYVSLLGLEKARAKAHQLIDEALESLNDFGSEADLLRELARYVIERNY